MCGRFSLSGDIDFYADYFGASAVVEELPPSWNVAPTDQVYVVAQREGERVLESMKWGLVPHWAKDTKSIQINARSETVATAPAFRDSFARKRCLIPADGFYEWESPEKGRTPHWIHRADGFPVGFAGIWSTRRDDNGEWTRTCSILTKEGRGVVAPLHDRMPIALPPERWASWLDRTVTDVEEASRSLQPIDDNLWMEREVSSRVNSVRNNDARLWDPPEQGRLM
ncbi:MAG TPA: SOS response-associated peptidase [Acidimicrobiia bacterium]|jgi:putative SOS response-associated peptidase YedK|nr:SOS response-associated peptidase [Acidimicrobiia bacterium]